MYKYEMILSATHAGFKNDGVVHLLADVEDMPVVGSWAPVDALSGRARERRCMTQTSFC